jgi:putative ABC transport system ATP-binding protein
MQFPDVVCGAQEHLLLLGESGTGKTTLLHLLAGMLRPSAGSIVIDNQEITNLSSRALDRFRGARIGIVFQTAHFVHSLTVEDNLTLPQFLAGNASDKQRARDLLARMNLAHKLSSRPSELSIGEQQRVAIARALMNNPAILLADEPTSALDDKNASQVIDLLEAEARNTGASLIIVTHDQRLKGRFEKRVTL